jgi:hypothetical protein
MKVLEANKRLAILEWRIDELCERIAKRHRMILELPAQSDKLPALKTRQAWQSREVKDLMQEHTDLSRATFGV